MLCKWISTLRSAAEPDRCGGMILWHTVATPIENVTKHALGESIALIGGAAKPSHGLHVILGYALPFPIYEAKNKLRLRISLLSGQSIPLCRLCVVAWQATAFSVHRAELVLGLREAMFGLAPTRLRRLLQFESSFLGRGFRQLSALPAARSHETLECIEQAEPQAAKQAASLVAGAAGVEHLTRNPIPINVDHAFAAQIHHPLRRFARRNQEKAGIVAPAVWHGNAAGSARNQPADRNWSALELHDAPLQPWARDRGSGVPLNDCAVDGLTVALRYETASHQ